MTAKTVAKPIKTKRLRVVQTGVMMTLDRTYLASKYASGQWQLEGPDGWHPIAANARDAKRMVREHQLPKRPAKRVKKA